MRLLLFTLLVFGGIGFAQYYRHVQVYDRQLIQQNLEIRHQLNRLKFKFDRLREYTEEFVVRPE